MTMSTLIMRSKEASLTFWEEVSEKGGFQQSKHENKSNERKFCKHVLLVDTYVIYIRYPVTECDFLSTKTESVLIIRIFHYYKINNVTCHTLQVLPPLLCRLQSLISTIYFYLFITPLFYLFVGIIISSSPPLTFRRRSSRDY